MDKYDVIIVGAATSGTYMANLLAKNGFNVLVIDKDDEETIRDDLDVIHFPTHAYTDFNIKRSEKGDEDYIKEFSETRQRSALDNYEKHNHLDVTVLHLNKFIKKLRDMAISSNAHFMFEREVIDLSYDENGKINGVILENNEVLYSSLVIDASGIDSFLRTKINDPYIENFKIGDKDRFYVLLYYVDFINNKEIKYSTSWTYYKCWIAPQPSLKGGIIGCGATTSKDYVRKCMDKFLNSIKVDEFTITKEELSSTPYVRQPYSFISDHFLSIGDASALTNPMNGEGIMWTFYFIEKIKDPLIKALKDKDTSIDNMWNINYLYQTTYGARDAYTRCAMKGVMDNTKKDNDFLFKNNIIFKSDDDVEPPMIKTLIKGVFKGEFKLSSYNHILKQAMIASKLKKLYINYPKNKNGYFKFKKKADKLWTKAGSIADLDKDSL